MVGIRGPGYIPTSYILGRILYSALIQPNQILQLRSQVYFDIENLYREAHKSLVYRKTKFEQFCVFNDIIKQQVLPAA